MNRVRSEKRAVEQEKRQYKEKIESFSKLLVAPLGDDLEFEPLATECFEIPDKAYVYKLCPFDKVIQKEGGREVRLG